MGENVLTQEGYERLVKELKELKEIKLKEVAVRIKDAKDLGDLSENAEYHEAKNEQAFMYGKVLDIEKKIKNARIINSKNCSQETIDAGCSVEVENRGEKMTFYLVGSDEVDPANNKISIHSPIGSALVGHKAGEAVSVKTPGGEEIYKIIKVL